MKIIQIVATSKHTSRYQIVTVLTDTGRIFQLASYEASSEGWVELPPLPSDIDGEQFLSIQ